MHDTKAIFYLRGVGSENIPNLNDKGKVILDAAMLEIPVCTDDERFMQPTKWAVRKDGQKKAVRVWDTHSDAEHFIHNQKPVDAAKMSVTERKGGYMKCLWYCGVSGVCPHNRKEEKEDE